MKFELSKDYLSTTQVAEALGISVSSVKRWVEDGILPAHKTAGGHRKLRLTDVLDLARQNELPVCAQDFVPVKRTRRVKKTIAAKELADSLHHGLIAGESGQVRRVVRGAYADGLAIEALADAVVAPAMQQIGADWERGRIDIMHEHRASRLCEATLYELKAVLEATARRDRPIAVGGALEGDMSEIPTLLAQMTLLGAGWNAINLGANTPIASLGRAMVELKPRLVWLSISHLPTDDSFATRYTKLYRQAERAGVAVVLGGRAITESLRKKLPYTAFGDGFTHLAAFARTLMPPARRPRRGRPPS